MQFIEPQYINVPEEGQTESVPSNSVVRNGKGKGNYSGSLALTGSNPSYQQNHIYDLAGNVYEWTMEVYSTDWRVSRGGDYLSTGFDTPASCRCGNYPDGDYRDYIGFRAALYL